MLHVSVLFMFFKHGRARFRLLYAGFRKFRLLFAASSKPVAEI